MTFLENFNISFLWFFGMKSNEDQWRHDNQYNDIQYKDTQHDVKYATLGYADCRLCWCV
jgi:hypothetical protein